MIHDILCSLIDPFSKRVNIEDYVVSDAVSTFLHPGEKKILQDIIQIIHLHREIAKFAKIYGAVYPAMNKENLVETDEPLQQGLYLQCFAHGIEKVLDEYLHEIADLERRYLKNPTQTLLFIFHKVNIFQPLFLFLRKLIRGVRSQRLHGCAIIQYLHQNVLHGDQQIYYAMKTIQKTVNIAFLKQLMHWLLYAKIDDPHGEFFIQCSEYRNNPNNSTLGSEKGGHSVGSGRHTATTASDAASTYAEIWHYEINFELLPHYLSSSWAEKVLFIGQTVLMFKTDTKKQHKKAYNWNDSDRGTTNVKGASLWNGNERKYFGKLEALQNDAELNVAHYEKVVDEIKMYVSARLSEIAVNQADLVQQLKLIKDFYLLGRGELFLEFIRRTIALGKAEKITENTIRDLVRAFDAAAASVGVPEDFDQFSLTIPKDRVESDEVNEFGYIPFVSLQYKINWPLHLLFSPKVVERYNELFRFLLLIKKLQFQMHMIWCSHTRESKSKGDMPPNVLRVRNMLMFFMDNLQYYIQIDVLESQYSILMNTVQASSDFEQMQRAHSVFQANILSLCFLLTSDDATKTSMIQSQHSSNSVHSILYDIFHLCGDFNTLLEDKNAEVVAKEIGLLEDKFSSSIEQLINLLVCYKSAAMTTHASLSQLLLRLDFNHWFSAQNQKKET